MLRRVSVRDFQSLKRVDLDIGGFTVISGPSNSGKSAFMRAVRMVAENVDSPSTIVRHGAKRAAAGLVFIDGSVALVRGKAKSEYTFGEETYPKAGKDVPDAVAEFLRFAEVEGESLSFAFQFDRPFLLDDPATQVAKVFGDLTNVTVLFAAVREANRRRLENGSRLKVRRQQLEELRLRAKEYVGVADRARKVSSLRETFARLIVSGREFARFRTELEVVKTAAAAIEGLEVLPPLPEPRGDMLQGQYDNEIARMRVLMDKVWQSETVERQENQAIKQLDQKIAVLDARYHRTLTESGTCPLCGQKVEEGIEVGAGS
jgi:DNA repair protein SbcC/Rad50